MLKLVRVLHFIDNVSEWSGKIFSFAGLVLVGVVLSEVTCRYLLNNPTEWVYETSLYIFGAMFMIGGAYTLLHGGHVNVDIVHTRLSPRARAITDIVTFVFFFIFPYNHGLLRTNYFLLPVVSKVSLGRGP